MFFKKWREVYYTSEMQKFFSAQNLLDDHNIKFKTDTVNNGLRMSMNNLSGTSPALSRNGVKNYYKISVEEKDESQARYFLSKI